MSKPNIITFYTNRGLFHSEVKTEMENNGGEIKIFVVKEPQENDNEEKLVYGLFFETHDGQMCDVIRPKDTRLKTYARIEHLIAALSQLGVQNISSLPMLTESNCKTKADFE